MSNDIQKKRLGPIHCWFPALSLQSNFKLASVIVGAVTVTTIDDHIPRVVHIDQNKNQSHLQALNPSSNPTSTFTFTFKFTSPSTFTTKQPSTPSTSHLIRKTAQKVAPIKQARVNKKQQVYTTSFSAALLKILAARSNCACAALQSRSAKASRTAGK